MTRALLELNMLQETGFKQETPERMAAFLAHLKYASANTGIFVLTGRVTGRHMATMVSQQRCLGPTTSERLLHDSTHSTLPCSYTLST